MTVMLFVLLVLGWLWCYFSCFNFN